MKAQFLTDLIIKSLPGRWWKVKAPLCYYSALVDAERILSGQPPVEPDMEPEV